ncbi:MAG: hypothetical protein ACK5LY_09875 [Lachnospirales bacterium]
MTDINKKPKESLLYEIDYRASDNLTSAKIYANRSSIEVFKTISFDNEYEKNTSIDLFFSSIISDIIFSINNYLNNKNIEYDDIELKTKAYITNPLFLANVKGQNTISSISRINIKIYIYTETTEDVILSGIYTSTLYNTLKNSIAFTFEIIKIL